MLYSFVNNEYFIIFHDLINHYLSYLENEALIAVNLDNSVVEVIKNNLEIVKNEIEKTYSDSLYSNLDKKFISTYNETLNIETESILDLINRNKEIQISEMGDLFTLEPENKSPDRKSTRLNSSHT